MLKENNIHQEPEASYSGLSPSNQDQDCQALVGIAEATAEARQHILEQLEERSVLADVLPKSPDSNTGAESKDVLSDSVTPIASEEMTLRNSHIMGKTGLFEEAPGSPSRETLQMADEDILDGKVGDIRSNPQDVPSQRTTQATSDLDVALGCSKSGNSNSEGARGDTPRFSHQSFDVSKEGIFCLLPGLASLSFMMLFLLANVGLGYLFFSSNDAF